MADFVREEFKEKIKNNEYNNISIRIINYSKRNGVKKVIDHNRNPKKNISISIPDYRHNEYSSHNIIPSMTLITNPSDIRQNKILAGIKNNAIINKISTANLRKISKKLNELKNINSSTNLNRGQNKRNHIIYVSKKDNSSTQNLENNKNQNENNFAYAQVRPIYKLSTNLTSKTFVPPKEPERKKSSIINAPYDSRTHVIDIKNQNNNYVYDSNTYKNHNINKSFFNSYKDFMTYNVKNNKTNNNLTQRNDGSNKIFYNNTLTTINEVKNGNLLLHKLNKKDLENLKKTKIINTNNISKENILLLNSINNKSFISQIPKTNYTRQISKDIAAEKVNPKYRINVNKIKYIKGNQSFQNIIRVSSHQKQNSLNINNFNIQTEYINPIKYPEYKENNNNIKVGLAQRNYNDNYKKYTEMANIRINQRPFLYKNNIRELINKSMDNKDIKSFNINNINNTKKNTNVHVIKNLSHRKDNNKENNNVFEGKIKEEERSSAEDSKHSSSNNDRVPKDTKIKTKKIIAHKLNFDSERNKEIIGVIKKHKEPLDSVSKKDKGIKKEKIINNIYNINTQNKNLNIEIKDSNKSKIENSEQIKNIIMPKNDDLNNSMKITLTAKKDLNRIFNTEIKDQNSIEKNKIKHINYKGVKYRLIPSLSVKDQLRKYIFGRKKNLGKSIDKYQYTEGDEDLGDKLNNTVTKEQNLNNYTYLELKDIKNIKRDTFITLHSIGGFKNRFDELKHSSSLVDLKDKIFKPYVSTHPEKTFKKRGITNTREKSERKIRGIKIEGNSDVSGYRFEKMNFSAIKNNFFGKSTGNIHQWRKKRKNIFKKKN